MRITFDNNSGTATIVSSGKTIILSRDNVTDDEIKRSSSNNHRKIIISGFGDNEKGENMDEDVQEDWEENQDDAPEEKLKKTKRHTGPQTVSDCMSLKKNGEPCGRTTKPGEPYCFFHASTCTAITSKGTKCSNGCMEGTDRCSYHAATCPGRTKSGEPCQLAAEFCRYHKYQDADDGLSSALTSTSTLASASVVEVATSKVSKVSKPQCSGTTRKGTRCRLKVHDFESEFCHLHS